MCFFFPVLETIGFPFLSPSDRLRNLRINGGFFRRDPLQNPSPPSSPPLRGTAGGAFWGCKQKDTPLFPPSSLGRCCFPFSFTTGWLLWTAAPLFFRGAGMVPLRRKIFPSFLFRMAWKFSRSSPRGPSPPPPQTTLYIPPTPPFSSTVLLLSTPPYPLPPPPTPLIPLSPYSPPTLSNDCDCETSREQPSPFPPLFLPCNPHFLRRSLILDLG